MTKKNLMLASTALALVSLGAPSSAGEMYVSVLGGLNWTSDVHSSFRSTNPGDTEEYFTLGLDLNADTGFVLGGSVGTTLENWVKGLSAEIESSYRRNDLEGHSRFKLVLNTTVETDSLGAAATTVVDTSGPTSATVSTFALMANVWYEHDMGWNVRPYLGGGIGWGRTKLDGAGLVSAYSDGSFDMSNEGFAWQLGAGFKYEAAPGVDVGIGYRYFDGPDIENPFFGGKFDHNGSAFENENHSVAATLSIAIN